MQNLRPLTLREKYARIERATQYPAMQVAPMIRVGIGPRALQPGTFGLVALILFFIGNWWAKYPPPIHGEHLAWFAVVAYAEAMRQRARQLKAFKHNVLEQHSWYVGDSVLRKILPFPKWLKKDRRIERHLDGPFVMLIGILLLHHSTLLGVWLIFSGAALKEFENVLFNQQRQAELDLWDNSVVSAIHGQIMDKFNRPHQPPTTSAQSHILATGLDDALRRQVRKQPKKQPSRSEKKHERTQT